MAQSSAAREPSMEEILASIRRIIESNDPVSEGQAVTGARNRTVEDPTRDFEDDEIELDTELEAPFVAQVAANDPGGSFVPSSAESLPLRPTIDPAMRQRFAEEAGMPAERAPERTLSLADVAARVRAAAGRVPEPVAQRAAPAPQPSAAAPAPQAAPAPVTESRPQPVLRAAEPMRAEQEPLRREMARDVPAPEFAERRPAEAVVTPVVEERIVSAESLPVRIEEQVSLLSDEAGQRIARSFNELADIFNGIERQSVEDMAREMLQPMLRDWLDDNLPTLVERLVREEIERVARGPRR
ncbi:PopZ family protein [Rhizobium straminoryzae]|uniref:DUF2497 domain-containing protein n=1 Tax=Rhizobium straminoryzae TaxID=1387186 RepID=A0A549T9B6_9HYPH|nr:DUF2497 domain-containing protein [Rhizobium straminoryzae]TRL38474.1 DUF2497 domain-containing protein [Rhizobium straminoryzae]